MGFVDRLNIQELVITNNNNIYFIITDDENDLNGRHFMMMLEKHQNGNVYPTRIVHAYFYQPCFCGNNDNNDISECPFMSEYMEDLLEIFKKDNRVRLELLFQ
jgi:hypothetical protein